MADKAQTGSRPSLVLGLETSCDETAAAVVLREPDGVGRVLSNVVRSQWEKHRPFGGVVPEIAARAHVECLDVLVREAMREADAGFGDLSAIAATSGPGLIGGLIVGAVTGKAIALARGLPFIAVHHLEAHALTVGLTEGIAPPYLLLLVSGGHTQLLIVRGVGEYERLGTTIDDALGEAFDKTAKLLGLGLPGGPAVAQIARQGDAGRFDLPRPMLGRDEPHFSFAGLKTAVRRLAEKMSPLNDQDVADIAAGFEAAIADVVVDRCARAMDLAA
ncbi:MAG: tRNA (adenosine(37)-N6)-threonylcarbamoyltransferase complex transferase subunit TsaD, partial [Hyphomicrobium sp.]